MSFSLENKETWWYVSSENMMLNHNIDGYTGLWSQGVHDSVEQTYHAYIAYGYAPFIDGIKTCWKPVAYKNPIMRELYGYYYKPQRYPIAYESMHGMSRDHVIYSLMAFIHSGMDSDELWEYVKRIPFMIGDNIGTTMTPKLWLWGRLISNKKIGNLYYPLVTMSAISSYYSNKLIEKIAGFGFGKEEHQTLFKPLMKGEKPKIVNFLASQYYPTYATKLTANMLSVLPNNWFVKIAKKYMLKTVPDKNYALMLLLGKSLTKEEITDLLAYKSMSGDRWSDQLNKWYSDRKLYILEQKFPDKPYTVANELDRDYAISLLEKSLQKI